MTFFYDLNKKLASIADKPETKQLNERDEGKPGKNFAKIAKDAGERYGSKAAGERVAGAVRNKLKAQGKLEEADMDESAFQAAIGKKKYGDEGMKALQKAGRDGASDKTMSNIRNKYDKYDEGIGDVARKVGGMAKKVGGAVLNKLGHGSDEDMRKDLQRKMGIPKDQQHGKPSMAKYNEEYGPMEGEGGKPMTPKQKSFAKLAPPADKITFADKIAGAKKEVDEVLGDVAANAMKKAVSGHGTNKKKPADEGWDDMLKDVEKRRSGMKTGDKIQGHKGEIEKTATGIRHTRKYDPKTGETDTGDDAPATGEKRGRGRPKKAGGPSQERVTAKSRKADRTTWQKKVKEDDNQSDDVKQAMAVLKKAGYKISKAADGAEELDEKAVSKAQQRFMGMVHATQKGEKAPSKEVGKVAKTMKKKDAEDFASTKHKGLPEKKKPEGKKREKTEEQGGTGTPTASSGFGFGKGIYDSINRDLEAMIAESMSVNMSNSTEGGQSLTITASDEDAVKLASLLKNAGLGGEHGEVGHEEPCPTCGSADCGCGDIDEALDENSPDWPTDEVESDDALQYSGGLNGPKSTGQTTVPVIASQEERQHTYEDDELARIKEMAGIREAKKVEEDDVEEGNKFTGNLAKARAAGKKEADLDGDGDMEKVQENILDMKRLWTAYKG
jgi:hypothetical protein